MEKFSFLFFAVSLVLITAEEVHAVMGSYRHHHGSVKLFVFGDSYVDTGNWGKSVATSWKLPYGITFPGKPAGRFSDGRVLTDYIASFLGIRSPVPYQWRKMGTKLLPYGMNFAYGGTGVFNTLVNGPNMTTQINFFQQLLEEKWYTKHDLDSSIALVCLAGNDYGTYLAGKGTMQGLPAFTTSVVHQLSLNLKRIHELGVKKIAVTAMGPVGCLPVSTASSSYQNCSETQNSVSKFHNQILQQTVQKLNNQSKESAFVILNLYGAFMSALKGQENHLGNSKFNFPLKPCCMGVTSEYSCGSVDVNGTKRYTVCEHPESSFFWDKVHPSQNGWHAVYSALRPFLHQLY
ncbi:hypothetical protein L1049_011867 [Liquidambar formosana]|uniref:GDSL esterase/lipase At5g03610-like n=1 Tax=Liquidambar formosana TaxID=63359 RepID=A0AAP0RS47_LIQFO